MPAIAVATAACLSLVLAACDADTLYGPEPTAESHAAALEVSAPELMEVGDSVVIEVRGQSGADGDRLQLLGFSGFLRDAAGEDRVITGEQEVAPPARTATARFTIPLDEEIVREGDVLSLEVFGYAITTEGDCVAATGSDFQQLGCLVQDEVITARGVSGQRAAIQVAHGRTTAIPDAGWVADLAVHPSGGRVFLSNHTRHQIEVFDISGAVGSFVRSVPVGSEPWGLEFNATGTELIVANSGGISLSIVPLDALQEDVGRRQEIPRLKIFEFTATDDGARWVRQHFSFSDRPQNIARDSRGRIVLSTKATEGGPSGAFRVGEWREGRFETRLVRTMRDPAGSGQGGAGDPTWTITNVDSIQYREGETEDQVRIFDGNLVTPWLPLDEAIQNLEDRGSDILADPTTWDYRAIALGDTTFVSPSGNRRFVAVGESNGLIMLWDAERATLSHEVEVADLFRNTGETVRGVRLNQDGTFGAARGSENLHFFDRGLRLQGTAALTEGGAGVALRPGMATNRTHAFYGTGDGAIRAMETTHYRTVGTLPIRDSVVGPLVSGPPLPEDNEGLTCSADVEESDPACVVARVYTVTDAPGLLVVRVRAGDLR
jgi:hypothetical protein